jgi:hypothetical protein
MSAAETQSEMTALRSLEMRSRMLRLDAQMNECVELLLSPEIAVNDLLHSVDQVADELPPGDPFSILSAPEDRRKGFFYPSRDLFVQGDGCSFTCVATEVEFLEGEESNSGLELLDARPIDYAAVTCESKPFPVLGFVQSADSESAYPLLLRSFSTLIELIRPGRFDALDRHVYRGLLGPKPRVDLVLVLWDEDREDDPRRAICELSRDLAEDFKQTLESAPRFPPVLNDIVCLRMNPKRFDARLRFVWRV